ncbi:MAG: hypothetical protein KAT90_08750 [Gammaproteobacteria bacterium]|nr:hypothetical protein [Gammaproteobacteria bacterium]
MPNGTNISVSTLSASVPLARESGLRGHADAVAEGQFVFVAIVEAFDVGETYVLDITVADNSALTVNTAVVGSITVTALGMVTVILDSENIDALAEAANTGAAPAFIGVQATLGGVTPDLTYEAFLAPTAND